MEYGPFSNCMSSFDKAIRGSALTLPPGQSSHVLRHTFASHFMMNGGKHPHAAKDSGAFLVGDDNALCTFVA